MSRMPECGQRRPKRRTRRRWISSARWSSISCSVIDHASASHGAARRWMRSVRARAHRLADHGVAARSARRTGAGPRRRRSPSACARSPPRRRAGWPQRAANSTRCGAVCATRDEHRLVVRRAAAASASRRGGAGSRRPSRGRCGTATGASPRRAGRPVRQPRGAVNPGAAGGRRRGTSCSRRSRPPRPSCACGAGRLARRRVTTAAVTAPAAKPVAASAAACLAGSGAGSECSSTRVWLATTGSPSTTSITSSSSGVAWVSCSSVTLGTA